MSKANQAVVATIKATGEEEAVLSTGVKAHLRPVAPRLLDDVASHLVDPEPPLTDLGPEYDHRLEPNPVDPAYLRTLRENAHERALAQIDAMIAFGVELLEDMPPDEEWLPKLRLVGKWTGRDLFAGVDLDNPEEKEFLYKKYVAVGNSDLLALSRLAGLTPQEVDAAVQSFPGHAERDTH